MAARPARMPKIEITTLVALVSVGPGPVVLPPVRVSDPTAVIVVARLFVGRCPRVLKRLLWPTPRSLTSHGNRPQGADPDLRDVPRSLAHRTPTCLDRALRKRRGAVQDGPRRRIPPFPSVRPTP